ncbi:hypothetical protein ACWEPL_54600 [Nonomuraea sp. NPDC004186]
MNGETVARAPAPPEAEAVLASLYREHWLALVRLAVLLVGDRESAEDVVQDVFSRLHGKRPGKLTLAYGRTTWTSGRSPGSRSSRRGARRSARRSSATVTWRGRRSAAP